MVEPSPDVRCVAHGCRNHRSQGLFKGDLCAPCWTHITTGSGRSCSFIGDLDRALDAMGQQIAADKKTIANLEANTSVDATVIDKLRKQIEAKDSVHETIVDGLRARVSHLQGLLGDKESEYEALDAGTSHEFRVLNTLINKLRAELDVERAKGASAARTTTRTPLEVSGIKLARRVVWHALNNRVSSNTIDAARRLLEEYDAAWLKFLDEANVRGDVSEVDYNDPVLDAPAAPAAAPAATAPTKDAPVPAGWFALDLRAFVCDLAQQNAKLEARITLLELTASRRGDL